MDSTFLMVAWWRERRELFPLLSLTYGLGDPSKVPHQTTWQVSKIQHPLLKALKPLRGRICTKSLHNSDASSPFPGTWGLTMKGYFKKFTHAISRFRRQGVWRRPWGASYWALSISRVPGGTLESWYEFRGVLWQKGSPDPPLQFNHSNLILSVLYLGLTSKILLEKGFQC